MDFHYSYLTESHFAPAVRWHFFKLRAVPCSNEFQQVEAARLDVTPPCLLSRSVDGQGNAVQWGSFDGPHGLFRVESAGIVHQVAPYALHEAPVPYYLTPTRLTTCTPDMLDTARRLMPQASVFSRAEALMHAVHSHIAYTPCHTTTDTTAAQVWVDPRGVCQDYAHALLALCRAAGLHARYANGLLPGEGQTHAWVEVSDGTVWLPFDPTHDIRPEWGYLKIAHGRDADDCPTNRGRFYGWTSEQMSVSVSVWQ